MNRRTKIKTLTKQSLSRDLTVSFSSLREKRKYFSIRRYDVRKHSRPRRHDHRCIVRSSKTMRELVAPEKAKKYQIAVFIKDGVDDGSTLKGIEVKNHIIELLRNLVPNRFKISMHKPRRFVRTDMIYIKTIYLQDEADLCIVQLAIQQYIWRIMKIVAVKSA